jgi:TonB family protein
MLRHPHIARVYALNADRLGAYLVTEYLDGRTLDTHMEESGKPLPMDEARPVIDDLCAALAYAHDLEVVHGDLQPANVFMATSGGAKLLDFGLTRAAATRNGRFDSRRVGPLTIAYASVEMLEGQAPDPRDDVYSLACLIYTMLAGAHPFDSRSAVEARRLALEMTPLLVLSSDQNAALARGLAFERAQRTPSVTALLADLSRTADPQPADEAPADEAPATAPRSARRVVRLPLLSISLPSKDLPWTDTPSLDTTPQAPPSGRVRRRYIRPALIVLLLAAVGSGIALVYRGHGSSATRPETASNPSPASASVSSAFSGSAAAASAPVVPPPAPVAISHKSKPPAVADTALVAAAQSGAPLAVLRPLPKAAAEMEDNDNCPYPRTAIDQGLTGTVFLLVYVTPDGKPMKTKVSKTSGSDVLDEAALSCVEQFGRFSAPPEGSPSGGYRGLVRFKWSFGI